jgi:DNA integrity scanning protein DisA with diadenylate cyclase activity
MQDKALGLSQKDVEEILETLRSHRGYIYPKKISEQTGFDLEQIERLLLKLATESYLKHFVVPKYKDRILLEEAREGFSFENFQKVFNKEEGYFDEALNDNLILLTAYKKNA